MMGLRCLWDIKWKCGLEVQIGRHYDTDGILSKGIDLFLCKHEVCEKQAENETENIEKREMIGDKRRL